MAVPKHIICRFQPSHSCKIAKNNYKLEKSVDLFTKFYVKQHNGRKLTWLNFLSRVDVKCNHFDKRYELQMSLQQTSILLLFNHSEKITAADISSQTNIAGAELEKNLKILSDLGIIHRTEEGKNILIQINTKFTRYISSLIKVKK